jgi:hypothetical protein
MEGCGFPPFRKIRGRMGHPTLFSEPEKLLMKKAISAPFARAFAADSPER